MTVIYFDNAATTMLKPPQVARAVAEAIGTFGGAGRGAHDPAVKAAMAVYHARVELARLFNAPDPARVVFASNATEALNVAISGLLHKGDHAITTAASHNSVLRPLYRKADEEGVELSILPVAPDASIDYEAFDALFRSNTRLAVVTHASNLTGDVYDIARMAQIAHAHGALFVVDAAQTAGLIDIDIQTQGINVLAFTGHKSLYGPQGTGGLALMPHVDLPPFKVGGSGVHSYDRTQPASFPEHLEAGTLNAHGIAGLLEGVRYIEQTGVDVIHARTLELAERFERGVREIPGVTVYGGHAGVDRCGIVALNVGDLEAGQVADALAQEWGICVRSGAHCAPLMHQALGTSERGAVRFSFSHFNTEEEIDTGISAIAEIVQSAL